MPISPRPACLTIVIGLALLAGSPLEAGVVYLALGDSNGFGIDDSTPASLVPSYGDQGYVKPFADFLGSIDGQGRPQVVNLSVPGELSTSFFSGVAPAGWSGRDPQLNLNYPTPSTSQNSLMISALEAAHASGDSVYVTFNIGINDFHYLETTPAWLQATPSQHVALFEALLNQITASYEAVLGEIQKFAPGADVLLPNFFDSSVPGDPSYPLDLMAITAANNLVEHLAPLLGAKSVDFYSIVHADLPGLTNPSGEHHLNQAGYAAVALALDAAVVPEPPSSLLLGVGLGLAGLAGLARNRIG